MRERYGMDVSCYDESHLATAVGKRRQASAGETAETYLARLAADGAEAEALAGSLRVTYSDFFRNPLAFALLEQVILPALVADKAGAAQGGEVRIWSAACAAGQEVWSVAILLEDLARAQDRSIPWRIFATDLSAGELAQARAGVYSAAALGNVRLRHRDGLFCRQGESFVIAPATRARVEFAPYDLLDKSTKCPPSSIYGDFDLALCSNVLLYYRAEAQRFILEKLRRCLAPGGYLVVGESERQIVADVGGFRAVAPPASVFRTTCTSVP